MNNDHFKTLWTVLGFVLVFYCLNTWMSSQGAEAILDIKLLDERPVIGALFAVPICAFLLALLSQIGVRFAEASGRPAWHERIPLVGLEGVDTSSREGRVYQAFFLTLFILIPAASLVHFIGKVSGADIVDTANPDENLTVYSLIDLRTFASSDYWDDRFRIGTLGSGAERLTNTVSWFPVLEPILLLALIGFAYMRVALLLLAIFHPRKI